MRSIRLFFFSATVALVALLSVGCGGGDQDKGVVAGTTASGTQGGDAETIGDAASRVDAGSASGDDVSGAASDASGGPGGSPDGGASSGSGDSSSSSSGDDSHGWPAGPEDKLTGVDAAKAKYTTCGKAWSCTLAACQSDPKKGCMDVCLNASSESVVSEMMDYVKCFSHVCHDKQCPKGDAACVADCVWTRCSGFAMKCNASQESGGKLCGTAFECFETCKGPETVQCLTKCYVTLAKPAQKDFENLWFCLAKSDQKDPFVSCFVEALGCISGGVSGKASCLEISMCDANCEKDAGGDKFPCTAKCYGTASEKAQQQYGDLMSCALKAQDGGKTAANCGKTVAICAGSKPDGTKGALGCQEISVCEQKCKQASEDDESCTLQCLAKATVTEASKWWDQAMCWTDCAQACGDKGGAKCIQTCFAKDCKKQSNACLGL